MFSVGQRVILVRNYLMFAPGCEGVVKQITRVGIVVHIDRREGGAVVNPAIPIGPLRPPEDYFRRKDSE
jgi:hypothetical protein